MFSQLNSCILANLVVGVALCSPLLAQTAIEIDSDTAAFSNRTISSGAVKISVDYKPFVWEENQNNDDEDANNLKYKLFYNNQMELETQDSTYNSGKIWLQDLDNDKQPEVMVSTFTGGAHCCTNTVIYRWQGNKFAKTETGFMDGGGGAFEDLNKDGKMEFLTFNNAFLYAFSSYAGSFPPSVILEYNQGKFKDVTRQYPQELKATVNQMYEAFVNSKKEDYEVNGILAGYVAQKILLGEYEDGWKFMLANYDQTSDWGLEIYKNDEVVGKYPDFPTALKAFLKENGYL